MVHLSRLFDASSFPQIMNIVTSPDLCVPFALYSCTAPCRRPEKKSGCVCAVDCVRIELPGGLVDLKWMRLRL